MSYKIAIVASEFNKDISDNLILGAKKEYSKDYTKNNIHIFIVPGAFEIPGTINKILSSNTSYDAIIGFGCVIKGETAHFEYICNAVSNGFISLSTREKTSIPIMFGVLTSYNYEQALERSDVNKKNKGGEVMRATLDTIKLYKKI